MADKKISELTTITGANTASGDLFVIVDVDANETKKITRDELTNALELTDFDNIDINGGTIDGVTIATSDITVGAGKTLDVSAGTLTLANDQISGDKIQGGTIDSTTITTLASTTGNITTVNATTVDTINIEVTNIKAKDGTSAGSIADSSGIVTIASAVLTTADINGGTVDGADITVGTGKTLDVSAGTLTLANDQISGDKIDGGTIGSTTITTLASTTGNITTVNATTVDTTNIEVTNVKAKDGTASASIADSTGVMTIASAVLTTADINAGTIDDTVIGGSTAAAGTFTTATTTTGVVTDTISERTATSGVTIDGVVLKDNGITATGGGSLTGTWSDLGSVTTIDINGGTIDGVTIGGASAGAGTFTTLQADTSLNVDGTITADGATIDGTLNVTGSIDGVQATFTGTTPAIFFMETDRTDQNHRIRNSSGDLEIAQVDDLKGSGLPRINIDQSGDIRFYDDTGTSQDFYWDASTSRLGLGTTAPATTLDVTGTVTADGLTVDGDVTLTNSTSGNYLVYIDSTTGNSRLVFSRDGTDRWNIGYSTSGAVFNIYDSVAGATRLAVGDNGDILFYEDTGTTAKLTWAASAEELQFKDNVKAEFGDGGDLQIVHNGTNSQIQNNSGVLQILQLVDDGDITLNSDDGSGDTTPYFRADGSTGEVQLYHYGSEKLATKSTGIDVTGTVTASGGVYLGGTGAANLLDDYEEGTWTPAYGITGGSFSAITYNATFHGGVYTKVGRMVTVVGYITTDSSTVGTDGDLQITGLPFAPLNTTGLSERSAVSIGSATAWAASGYPISGRLQSGTSAIFLQKRSSVNGETSAVQASDMATTTQDNQLSFSVVYFT